MTGDPAANRLAVLALAVGRPEAETACSVLEQLDPHSSAFDINLFTDVKLDAPKRIRLWNMEGREPALTQLRNMALLAERAEGAVESPMRLETLGLPWSRYYRQGFLALCLRFLLSQKSAKRVVAITSVGTIAEFQGTLAGAEKVKAKVGLACERVNDKAHYLCDVPHAEMTEFSTLLCRLFLDGSVLSFDTLALDELAPRLMRR